MKIHVKYFTSTGNTKWVCDEFKKHLEDFNHTVIISDVIKDGIDFDDDADMVGIIYPVWGSTLPSVLGENLLKSKKSDKKMFLIGNCGAFSGDTGPHWKKKIEKVLGYDVFYANHLVMPLTLNIPYGDFMPVSDDEGIKKALENAKPTIKKMCDSILNEERFIKGKDILGIMGGIFQRVQDKYMVPLRKKGMSINKIKCTNCNICSKICPMDNINVIEKTLIKKDNCIFCLRCYNLCPEKAFLVGIKSFDSEKYKRYKGINKDFVKILLQER